MTCCSCVPLLMKTGIVDPGETAVARQRLGHHVPATTNTYAATELLDAAFSMHSMSFQIFNMS
jgi:hypothetical protein